MFVQLKKFIVTEGNAEKVVNQFSGEGMLEKQEGFIDVTVMEKKVRRGDEEVMVMIRWESEEYWKQWEKSEAHIASHKAKLGKPKPEHIISSEGGLYHMKAVKNAVN
ncbi:antibiotic biosynthesis monooxygenase [Neobacillus cucumis]|uniref:antibiotic biosynthesis monooxygenase n=1 Tax=Neobacillus cucumis TaxID=1740721 RepID=UPI002E1AB39A|nr:antibiotic biosynthesis monooxygenase [Neobacillus cucumis]